MCAKNTLKIKYSYYKYQWNSQIKNFRTKLCRNESFKTTYAANIFSIYSGFGICGALSFMSNKCRP